MKSILTIFFLSFFLSASGALLDTLPNWNFYYHKKIVMEGNSDDFFTPKQASIKLDDSSPGNLVATFNYDVEATFSSTLEIRKGGQVIKTLEYSGNPSGSAFAPSVKNGSVFIIPLEEIIGSQNGERISLDFYYTDRHVGPTRVGSIEVIIRSRE
jgi:uncharacterized GH25 family protein